MVHPQRAEGRSGDAARDRHGVEPEFPHLPHPAGPSVVRSDLARFASIIKAHYGKTPIIYTTVDFHRKNLEGHFKGYSFWLRSVADNPDKVYDGRDWTFWQYTGTGIVPGVPGQADISVFSGNSERLEDLAVDGREVGATARRPGTLAAGPNSTTSRGDASPHAQISRRIDALDRPSLAAGRRPGRSRSAAATSERFSPA